MHSCIGYCIHFKTGFIQSLLTKPIKEEFPFLALQAEHIINITPEESNLVEQSFRDIISEYERFSPEKDYLLRNYIHILLLRIREIYRPHAKQIMQTGTHAMKITSQFKRLVEKNFLHIRKVKKYAAMLYVTPKHLSEVVKINTGKSPRGIINYMLVMESKVLLGSIDKTVTEIG